MNTVSRHRFVLVTLLALITALAIALRLPRLDQRPMHTDEAVHAVKLGAMLESGVYEYDPSDYHGPTLYYFAMPVAWFAGQKTLADLTETSLRVVTVAFGAALVVAVGLASGVLGRSAALIAALLTALSPAMVFYSRYYIQETLLIFFTLAALLAAWRFAVTGRMAWAITAGAFLGLMHATKETAILAWTAMAFALVFTYLYARPHAGWCAAQSRTARHAILAVLAGAIVSALLVSNFLSHPKAIADSWLTYGRYLKRADGAALHDHPWYYYLKLLLFTRNRPGPWWSEGLILALACVGAVSVLADRHSRPTATGQARLFLVFYTVSLTALYALIPYKTPWCMLGFLHGMILLAGLGASRMLQWARHPVARAVVVSLLAAGLVHLGVQAYRSAHRYDADPRNPYVYGHSTADVVRLAERVAAVAELGPQDGEMIIKVVGEGYWPLPWYFRHFRNVGYWSEPPVDADAPVIVASLETVPLIDARLRNSYQREYYGLRPEVPVVLYVQNDLWSRFMAGRGGEAL